MSPVRRSMALSVADQAVVSGTNFLFAVVAARRLGPEMFGIFALIFTGWLLAQGIGRALVSQPFMISPYDDAGPVMPANWFVYGIWNTCLSAAVCLAGAGAAFA